VQQQPSFRPGSAVRFRCALPLRASAARFRCVLLLRANKGQCIPAQGHQSLGKWQQLREMMRPNEMSGRKVFDLGVRAGRALLHASNVMVPSEFNLSSFNVPQKSFDRPPIPHRSQEPIWSNSLRRESTPRWRPQLIVPRGLELHTSRRISSFSALVLWLRNSTKAECVLWVGRLRGQV